jgi:hypothetical protein
MKRKLPSGWMPPSKLASPPSTRAVVGPTLKPPWVKSTLPRALPSSGVSGEMRTSLPASTTLPLTVDARTSNKGMLKASFRSATPLPLASASALWVHSPTGETLTKRSMSASGPRPLPSITSTERSVRLRMPPCTRLSSTPNKRACALRISIAARSKISSPLSLVKAGHGDTMAGSPPLAGTPGT